MRIEMIFKSKTPLLMHNEQLSDSANPIVRELKAITAKKTNKTEKDEQEMAKLEWFGSLYNDDKNKVVIPCRNLIRCLREAGAIIRKGKTLPQAVSPNTFDVPLIVEPTRDINKLWEMPIHVDRRQVKVQKGRIARTRPIFPVWGIAAQFTLLENILDLSTLESICEMAGLSIGLGDARVLGYGRFDYSITKLK